MARVEIHRLHIAERNGQTRGDSNSVLILGKNDAGRRLCCRRWMKEDTVDTRAITDGVGFRETSVDTCYNGRSDVSGYVSVTLGSTGVNNY